MVPKVIAINVVLLFLISCGTQQTITESDLISSSTKGNLDNFGSLLWNISNDSIIKFNKKNLKIIKKKGKEKPIYIKSLNKYVFYLTELDYNPKKISFEQEAYIISYLIDFELEFQGKLNLNNVPEGSRQSLTFFKEKDLLFHLMYNENNKKYKALFEKNNYFNLSLFKEKYIKNYRYIPVDIKKIRPTSVPSILE